MQVESQVVISKTFKSWCAAMDLLSNELRNEIVEIIDVGKIIRPYFYSFKRMSFQKRIASKAKGPIEFTLPLKQRIYVRLIVCKVFKNGRALQVFPKIEMDSFDVTEIVRARLSTRLGTRYFAFDKVKFRDFYRFCSVTLEAICFADKVIRKSGRKVYVYNGRDLIEASFVLVAKQKGISVLMLERGSGKNRWQTFRTSPHYFPEWWKLIQDFNQTKISQNQISEGKRYLERKIRGIDTYKGELWNQDYENGSPDEYGSYSLYLATSTFEYSPFLEYQYNDSSFEDQFEAVMTLAKILAGKGKNLVVRRHPNSLSRQWKDNEKQMWQAIGALDNVIYIEPESRISTYSLITGAERVYVWMSSGGFDSLAMGKPTFSFSCAKWAWEDDFRCRNYSEILASMTKNFNYDLAAKVVEHYANFMGNSGEISQLFSSVEKDHAYTRDGEKISNLMLQSFRTRSAEVPFKILRIRRRKNC